MPKLYTFPADNVWFTSDTHFGHANILRFCKRPFGSIEEMDEALIRNWNETVPPDGIVFHLGDFAFAKSEEWEKYANALNGRKYLILGNHDFRRIMDPCMKCFEEVAQQMTIRVDGQPIILNHNPFLCYGGAYADTWQLFGHVHSGPLSTVGKDLPRLEMLFPTQYDVGVDNNDFRPVSFEEVRKKITGQVERSPHPEFLCTRRNSPENN